MALPLCGRRARSKLRVGAAIRAGSGGPADRRGRESYARYPLYPQADSAWIGRFFVTATVRGRDDLPETGDSLPSHSLSQGQAGRLRAAGRIEAKGRAADEAAARRKLRACPLADAKAACFVKRPRDPGGLRARGGPFRNQEPSGSRNRTGGTPDFGPGPVRRKARLRPARRHRRIRSFGFLFAGQDRGFGPGSCETRQGPGLRFMDLPGGTGASAPDPAGRGTKGFGRRNRQGGNRDFGSRFAERRTAGASAPSGSPRGHRIGLRLLPDSGGCGVRASALATAPRNPPAPMPEPLGSV